MKFNKTVFFSFCLLLSTELFAQGVKIGTNSGAPNAAAVLELESVNQGLLFPRLSNSERDAIPTPIPEGLQIYNTNVKCNQFYNGSEWLCGGACSPASPVAGTHVPSGNQIVWNWNALSSAEGYKWNTSNDYASATDVGVATTATQTGLSYGTGYSIYIWGYNLCGASANPGFLTSTTTPNPCAVGTIGPGGGYIFYCGNAYPGYIGLEAAPADQSSGAPWGCGGSDLSGAEGLALGTGSQNTTDIVNDCAAAGIAARICDDLDLNGYTDWFLPSRDELAEMYTYLKLAGLGGFSNALYWSSSEEIPHLAAWIKDFGSGSAYDDSRNNLNRVRAIRRF